MRRLIGLLFTLYVGLVAAFAFSPRQAAEPPPPQTRIDQLLMLDGLALEDRLVVVGEAGRIFLSGDGRDWRPVATPTHATLTALASIDGRRLVAVGHDGVILRSEDGGEQWALVREDPAAEGPLLAVHFDARGHGLAVGAYGLMLESRDGGLSWRRRPLDFGDPHLNAIAQGPDGRLLIAGEAGTLLRADPDGEDWEPLDSPYEGSYFGLLSMGDGALLAFGMRGHLYRSRDGGGHWEALASGTDASLFGGLVLEGGQVLLVGQNGQLLWARDGTDFSVREIPGRATHSALLRGRDGGLLLVGEGGVTRLGSGAWREGMP